MKLHFAKYKREFQRPFRYGDTVLTHREGLLFRLQQGPTVRYSEAAPLGDHSPETLAAVEAEITKLSSTGFLALEAKAPSLRFAADCLQLPEFANSVRSNALLSAAESLGELFEQYELLAQEGYQTFKLKLHPQNFSLVMEFLKNISGGRNVFRLDANGSLQDSHWKHFLQIFPQLRPDLIEYIEEPLADWSATILREVPVALAIDESFREERDRVHSLPIAVYILKPTTLGSHTEIQKFCANTTKRVIFTSCLETEIGRRNLLQLLSHLKTKEACGLSVGNLFCENFLPDEALYRELPPLTPPEGAWLAQLAWQELP